ncbi:DMT family transporter [Bradyrhizobium diazoefficiens]|nr:DMT family transporter [Bradyrhizobium diazoefficiens]QQO20663.1 DMT family transporter [Bradyrhizobium diazoefficiens]
MTPNTPLNKCNRAIRSHAWGLLLVVATAVGWGLGWPMMKLAMHDWPPLFARGCAGLAAALGLAIIAVVRGQNLLPSRSLVPRLALGAATNVFAPMGLAALALLWLTVAQAALLTYSMPIWAILFAWPILGERPRLRSVIALCLGVAGLVLLMGASLGGGTETFPGVALALAAAILFALGAVTSRTPIPLPPIVSTAWQIGLGSAAMIVVGLTLNGSEIRRLSFAGAGGLAYQAVCSMALCYLSWFAALERVPAATASTGLLLVPVVGALSAAAILGEALGFREICAFVLTLGGVALELRGRG